MASKIKKILKQNIGALVLPYLPWRFCDFGFSGRIIIEPTNACNLRCPLCPVSSAKRGKGFLSLENFKKIIDDILDLKSINFGWSGEPLLNKELFEMVKCSSARGIKTIVSTNTVLLNERVDEILASGLDNLIVCLDGASKETHEKYRVGSNFESIKKNIAVFCGAKRERGLKKPYISLQCLLTKYNEHEIPQIIELAKSLGVQELSFKTLSLGSSVSAAEKIKRAEAFLPSGGFSRYNLKNGEQVLKSQPKLCSWLRQAVILWNGDVVPCCYDVEGTLAVGNVFSDGGFKKVRQSEKYKKYRQKIIKKEFALCRNCGRVEEYSQSVKFHEND
ncbi:MAG: radical SAM protein [Candidatus Nealsonbacteria bacterium]